MAAAAEDGEREVAAGRRHHDVENHVGLRSVDDVAGVGPDHGVDEPELRGPPPRPLDVDVDQSDDGQAVDLPRGVQPGATHSPATNEHGSQQRLPPTRPRLPRFRSLPETLAP